MQRWSILRPVAAIAVYTMIAGCLLLGATSTSVAPPVSVPELVELRPGSFSYRASGEFTRDGKPARAPIVTVTVKRTLAIMRHQVSAADYRRCVEAGVCATSDPDAVSADHPAIKVSWRDATAYAAWLSRETRVAFRLPTDEEWAYAASDRFDDDALPPSAYNGAPIQRALAIYERHAAGEPVEDARARPIGTFGANDKGLLDIAGNVWEWTNSCFTRNALDTRGGITVTNVNCGVRVVEGRHRTYVPDFLPDARAGGCSISAPPSNLGFRLVRADGTSALSQLLEHAQRLFGLVTCRDGTAAAC
jgi:formylglycine-generating enzyme required for sulfatase activity